MNTPNVNRRADAEPTTDNFAFIIGQMRVREESLRRSRELAEEDAEVWQRSLLWQIGVFVLIAVLVVVRSLRD